MGLIDLGWIVAITLQLIKNPAMFLQSYSL